MEAASGGAAHDNEYAAVKFTSPITGTLDISVRWWGEYYGAPKGSTSDVIVFLNGTSLYEGLIAGFAGKTGVAPFGLYEAIYTDTIQVNEGDEIILAAGEGGDGGSADRVGLSATIEATAVPEPSSLLALFAGLSGIGGIVLRRRS
ncbi:MAG: PEP-CTERM sorting domain-containing protein [Armatimonadetes bacterium]|nr:PEP-CTERM sorting domain-containing protein [Armatimonadota bacterium]